MAQHSETHRKSGTEHEHASPPAPDHPAEHPPEQGANAGDLGGIDPAELVRAAAEIARDNPHAALAGALGIGFLLGGGLTPRLLASIAVFAGRRYLAEAAREALTGAVEQQIDEAKARC